MAQKRLSMRSIREVLRLKHEFGRSYREIAAAVGVSISTVGTSVSRATAAGIPWPLPEEMDDAALESALFAAEAPSPDARPEPDWAYIHRELKRHKGVTLRLLCLEYLEAHPGGYQYSRCVDCNITADMLRTGLCCGQFGLPW